MLYKAQIKAGIWRTSGVFLTEPAIMHYVNWLYFDAPAGLTQARQRAIAGWVWNGVGTFTMGFCTANVGLRYVEFAPHTGSWHWDTSPGTRWGAPADSGIFAGSLSMAGGNESTAQMSVCIIRKAAGGGPGVRGAVWCGPTNRDRLDPLTGFSKFQEWSSGGIGTGANLLGQSLAIPEGLVQPVVFSRKQNQWWPITSSYLSRTIGWRSNRNQWHYGA